MLFGIIWKLKSRSCACHRSSSSSTSSIASFLELAGRATPVLRRRPGYTRLMLDKSIPTHQQVELLWRVLCMFASHRACPRKAPRFTRLKLVALIKFLSLVRNAHCTYTLLPIYFRFDSFIISFHNL